MISDTAHTIIVKYLLDHEYDIAWKENDFYELHDVFVEIIGFEPRSLESEYGDNE